MPKFWHFDYGYSYVRPRVPKLGPKILGPLIDTHLGKYWMPGAGRWAQILGHTVRKFWTFIWYVCRGWKDVMCRKFENVTRHWTSGAGPRARNTRLYATPTGTLSEKININITCCSRKHVMCRNFEILTIPRIPDLEPEDLALIHTHTGTLSEKIQHAYGIHAESANMCRNFDNLTVNIFPLDIRCWTSDPNTWHPRAHCPKNSTSI
jgi:hypothetical protein